MELTLAIDFGSTYTKLAAFDLSNEALVGTAKAASTVETDIMDGLNEAIENLRKKLTLNRLNIDRVISCSSAAGGLRMVVAGLVHELTTKAAREAALGAGAKLVGTYSNGISLSEIKQLEQNSPDLILLTGGTDGGNSSVILHNSAVLAASELDVPIILAGNKMAAQEAQAILHAAGKYVVVSENVLPELHRLNIEPARAAIREIFMQRITLAKGLDKVQSYVGNVIIPTPMAVLRGAALLAHGFGDEQGIGELVVIDVGGATTDVSSIAHGYPSASQITVKGLPEPYEKRTVEGDLGIRYNAQSILEAVGTENIIQKIQAAGGPLIQPDKLEKAVQYLSGHVDAVPEDEESYFNDIGLASSAVDIATRRHAGVINELYYPSGKFLVQYGKDLTGVKSVVGTGGIFAYGKGSRNVLKSACFDKKSPESLRPTAPEFFADDSYILYAVGLLTEFAPLTALKIIKKYLKKL